MNAGHVVLRKMLLAASVLAACSWLAPNLFAQTGTDPTAASRAQKPSVRAGPLPSSHPKGKELEKLGQLPMYFEENRGQTDSRVKFLSRGRGYTLFLTENEAVLALRKKPSGTGARPSVKNQNSANELAVLRMRLAGASHTARISGEEQLPGKIFYATSGHTGPLSGNATYQRVKYAQVYPGIALEYYGNEKQLEFDFVVAPHADPGRIRLSFSGAGKITLTKHGELSLRVSGEEVRLKKPLIYQERNGERTEIAGGYVLTGKGKREAFFKLAPYDPSLPLVIDPQIDFSTYLGGSGYDTIRDIRVLPTGEIYVFGETDSTDFPTTQTLPLGLVATSNDCFLSKLAPDGSALLYSVIFADAQCSSMAVDLFGKVHLSIIEAGNIWGHVLRTLAQDNTGALTLTPLQGAFDFTNGFLEGPAYWMQVDSQGNVYMVANVQVPLQPSGYRSEFQLYKVDASGQLLGTRTLLAPVFVQQTCGGPVAVRQDEITGFAVDDAGHAYVIGKAVSAAAITPTNALQPSRMDTDCADGFVMEIDTNTPNNFTIEYASYLGGSGYDGLSAFALGHDGALYITGVTGSTDFPTTPGPYSQYQCSAIACTSAFLVKLDLTQPPAQQLVFGNVFDMLAEGQLIAALPGGLPAVLGSAQLFQEVNPIPGTGQYNSPLIVFSTDGTSILFASYLLPTSAANSGFSSMASNGSGKLYVAGTAYDGSLASLGAAQQTLAGNSDGLIASISGIITNSLPTVDLGPQVTLVATSQSPVPFTLDCSSTLPCNISDPDGDALVSYRWIGPNGFTAFSTSGPPVASVQLPIGSHQFNLIVTDDQGAVGVGGLTVDVVSSNNPPTISISSNFVGFVHASGQGLAFLSGTVFDADGDPLSVTWTGTFGTRHATASSGDDVLIGEMFPYGSSQVTLSVDDGRGGVTAVTVQVDIVDNTFIGTNVQVSPGNDSGPGSVAIGITFSNVTAPGNTSMSIRRDLVPMPPANLQNGSPPYYFDLSSTASYTGPINICIGVRDFSFAVSNFSFFQYVAGNWTLIPSTLDTFQPLFPTLCGQAAALGTFAIFTPEVPANRITTIAGTIPFNAATETCYPGPGPDPNEGGLAIASRLWMPEGAAFDAAHNYLYFTERCGHRARRIDLTTGLIRTMAGTGVQSLSGQRLVPGCNTIGVCPADTAANSTNPALATMFSPTGVALDPNGNLYISDSWHCRIRKLSLDASGNPMTITTVVGTGTCGFSGDGGPASAALLNFYLWIRTDASGNLYISDYLNRRVRMVTTGGDGTIDGSEIITTISGGGASAPSSTPADPKSLSFGPLGLGFAPNGDLYVGSIDNSQILRIQADADGRVDGTSGELASFILTNTLFGVAADSLAVMPNGDLLWGSGFCVLSGECFGPISRQIPGANGIVDGANDETRSAVAGYDDFASIPASVPWNSDGDGHALSARVQMPVTIVPIGNGQFFFLDSMNGLIRKTGYTTGGPINWPPLADSQSVSTGPGTPLPIVLTGGDLDYDPLTFLIVSQPSSGQLSGAPPSLTYTPNPGFQGTDSFTFKVNDGKTDSNLATVQVTVAQGPAVINIVEHIVVTDSPALLPSAMIGVNESITVTDAPAPLPSALIGVNENITVTDAPAPLPSAMIGVTENIAVTDAPTVVPPDTTPPVVTPPPSIVVAATETLGARGNVSAALQTFLLGGTATDAVDPSSQRQPPQVNGANADDTTLFPVGPTTVTFRFRDASNNIGTATTLVIVDPPIGGAVNLGGTPITPTDPYNTPMPMEVTFTGVTQPGLVTAVPMFPPPAAPTGFQISGTVFDIVTTAIFTPPIEVCFIGSGFTARDRIFHSARGFWVDVTSLVTSTKICGRVNSLSPFAVATPLNNVPSANAGLDQIVEATSNVGAGVTLLGSGIDPDGDVLAFAWSGPCGSSSTAAATFTCPLGASTMTLVVSDGRGGSASASLTITVRDTTPPALALPANITVTATSAAGAVVTYSATAIDLVSGAIAPACSPASGSTFPIGATTVDCTATDAAGNAASGSFKITVLQQSGVRPPELGSITPNGAMPGSTLSVTLRGVRFVPGNTTILFSASGIAASDVNVLSSSLLTATFTLDSSFTGPVQVRIGTPYGISNARTFEALSPPTLIRVTPARGEPGTQVQIRVQGKNLPAGALLLISGAGVQLTNVVRVSRTLITAVADIAPSAAPGPRSITVNAGGFITNAVTFTLGK